MLLEVGRHGRVAAQSLQLLPPHAAAAAGRGLRGGAAAHCQDFGLLAAAGGEVRVLVVQDAADVAQQVVEEGRDALVTWRHRRTASI